MKLLFIVCKQVIKDWHLILGLGIILIIEGVPFVITQTLAFTVSTDFGEAPNKEKPTTLNVKSVPACYMYNTYTVEPLLMDPPYREYLLITDKF